MSSRISEAAQLLAAARESHVPIKEFPPDLIPRNIGDAYAIQDIFGREQGFYGWKVGVAKDGHEPHCALLLGNAARRSPLAVSRATSGIEDVELEIAVTLQKDLAPIGRDYRPAEIEAAIGSLHLALELVGSRFENRRVVSPLSAIADHQSNVGVLLGAPLADWPGVDLAALTLRLRLDGREMATVSRGASLAGMLAQLAWLARHAADRHAGLRAGDVIITGARIGPVPVTGVRTVEGEAPPFAPIRLVFDAHEASLHTGVLK